MLCLNVTYQNLLTFSHNDLVRFLAAQMIEANLASSPTDDETLSLKLNALCVYARLASLFASHGRSERVQYCFDKALTFWNQGYYLISCISLSLFCSWGH